MTIHFDPLIKKKQAITYIDDTIMQSQDKDEMFTIIHEYHSLLRKAGLKAAPEKTFFFVRKVKFLGHVISSDGIQPIAKRVQDLKNLKSPESKRDVMRVLGCLGFYSCYIKNLHVDSQPFYELIRDSTPFHWTEEHEKLFQSIKDRISEDTVLAIPSTHYPFHVHVDSSNVGTGSILIQQFPEGKRIISFNSRVFGQSRAKDVHNPSRTMWCSFSFADVRALYYRLSFPYLPLHGPQTHSLLMGTKRTIVTPIFPLPSNNHQVSEPQNHLHRWKKSCLPRYS